MQGLTIETTDDTFEKWVNSDFVPKELKQELLNKSILLVPDINFVKEGTPLFTTLLEDVTDFLRNNLDDPTIFDICAGDSPEELSLNSDYRRIGHFLVKNVALPVLTGLIVAYITTKFIESDNSKPNINIVNTGSGEININNQTTNVQPRNTEIEESKAESTSKKPHKKMLEPTQVTFSITVVDSKSSKTYHYKGPAKNAETITEQILKDWNGKDTTN